jgi:hypothetical protein
MTYIPSLPLHGHRSPGGADVPGLRNWIRGTLAVDIPDSGEILLPIP